MRVHYVSFSAHADFIQTSQFIDELRPAHIVLVHGEANMMASLKKQLVGKYEQEGIGVWSPDNTETVTLTFHESKVAKVLGSIAVERPKTGATLQGLVLHKNFQLTVCSMEEMGVHAGLQASHLIQRQHIPYSQPWEVLRFHLSRLFDTIAEVPAERDRDFDMAPPGEKGKGKGNKDEKPEEMALRILDAVTLRKAAPGLVQLEWSSNPVHDMVADAVLSVIMQTMSNPVTARAMAKEEISVEQMVNLVKGMLEHRYSSVTVLSDEAEEGPESVPGEGEVPQIASVLELQVDGHRVLVDVRAETVTCSDVEVQKRVEAVLKRIMSCIHPYGSCSCAT